MFKGNVILAAALAGLLPGVQSCSTHSTSTAETLAITGGEAAEPLLDRRQSSADSPAVPTSDPQAANDFFLQQRLPPGQTDYPIQHLCSMLRHVQDQEQRLEQTKAARIHVGDIERWIELGPGNVGGRTRALVIDPTAPDTMYAGGVAGGIWKTTDGGAHWSPTDDLMMNLAVTSIALNPVDTRVLYAATGEGFSWEGMVRGLGIFKSVDAGETWNQLESTVSGVPEGAFHWVNDIVISPNDPDKVYAATRSGVWRSLDAGSSWTVVLGNPEYLQADQMTRGSVVGCTELAVRTDTSPDVILAAFGSNEPDGLYRSDDGGDFWERIEFADDRQGRMALAIAPSDNDVMYISMAQNFSGVWGMLLNVFRSDDGGKSWEERVDFDTETGKWLLTSYQIVTGCVNDYFIYHQGWYDNVVAVDPVDPDMVWVGGVNLFRSDDGGRSFGLADGRVYNADDTFLHVDHHALVFHPEYDGIDNQVLFDGSDGGIARTERARASTTLLDCPPRGMFYWRTLNNGYGVTQFYHGDSAKDRDVFVGGTQDNGTNLVYSRNDRDSGRTIYWGDGGYVAINPTNSWERYVEYQLFPNIFKSTNSGNTFSRCTTGITDTDGLFITPFAMDQSNPSNLWTGGRRPWRTTNGAEQWRQVGNFPVRGGQISAIAIAPSDSSTVYLGFSSGVIARTSNGLDASPEWEICLYCLPSAYVSSIAVDHLKPELAYCTISTFGEPHVFKTEDGGSSWASIDGIGVSWMPDIPAHWIAIRPCNPQQLYVGTELGVFVSEDGGSSWNPGNFGLPHTVVKSLDFKDDNTLVAFTHGRGAFLAELSPCVSPRRPGGRVGPGL